MDALQNLPMPNPPAPEMLSVAALNQQDVPRQQAKVRDLVLGRLDFLDFIQIKIAALHVRHPKIWDLSQLIVGPPLLPLRDPSFNCGNVSELSERPPFGEIGRDDGRLGQ